MLGNHVDRLLEMVGGFGARMPSLPTLSTTLHLKYNLNTREPSLTVWPTSLIMALTQHSWTFAYTSVEPLRSGLH